MNHLKTWLGHGLAASTLLFGVACNADNTPTAPAAVITNDTTDADIVELPDETPPEATTVNSANAVDWTGRWTGVEGTFLDVKPDTAAGTGHYMLTMQYTLDNKGSFAGTLDGDAITFTRPDGMQRLIPGDGDATGLKWLAGKQDCLVVKPGEGYCRN